MITLKRIKDLTEAKLNCGDLSAKTRRRDMGYARFVAIKLSREFLPSYSLAKIGDMYNRDHATVLHSLKQFDIHKNQDYFKEYYKTYLECREVLKEHRKKYAKINLDDNYLTLDELKIDYKIKIIKIIEKSHNVINRQRKAIDRLTKIDIFKDIADLPDEQFKDFETRTTAFLNMVQKK